MNTDPKIPPVPWKVARNGGDEPMLSVAQAMFVLNYNGFLWRNGTWREGVMEAVRRLEQSGHVRTEMALFPFVTHGTAKLMRVVRLKPIPKVYFTRSQAWMHAPQMQRGRYQRRKARRSGA